MDAIAMRAAADESGQPELATAALAMGSQTTVWNWLVAQGSSVRLINEFNQLPPFSKWTAA